MIEIRGDFFHLADSGEYEAIVIPVNAILDSHGNLVMGAGVALSAKEKWPWMPGALGPFHTMSSICIRRENMPFAVLTMQTKMDWRKDSNLELIQNSASSMSKYVDSNKWKKVLLPRVGCGKGRLTWEEVQPILAPILDDRYYVTRER